MSCIDNTYHSVLKSVASDDNPTPLLRFLCSLPLPLLHSITLTTSMRSLARSLSLMRVRGMLQKSGVRDVVFISISLAASSKHACTLLPAPRICENVCVCVLRATHALHAYQPACLRLDLSPLRPSPPPPNPLLCASGTHLGHPALEQRTHLRREPVQVRESQRTEYQEEKKKGIER